MEKLCVIVGFGPGNGWALARAFGGAGYRLVLISRSRAKQAKSLADLEAGGLPSIFIEADASDPAALRSAFGQIRAEVGQPAVLIYNAFAMRVGPASKTAPEDLIVDLRTNVAGALTAAREVLPAMREAKGGTILFTGGGLGIDPLPQFASVGVGKAALRNLALAFARELKADGIHVATVTICGMVKAGTHFDPEKIAAKFLELHQQEREHWTTELLYK